LTLFEIICAHLVYLESFTHTYVIVVIIGRSVNFTLQSPDLFFASLRLSDLLRVSSLGPIHESLATVTKVHLNIEIDLVHWDQKTTKFGLLAVMICCIQRL
jgi:hypothetical protein